MKIRMLKSAPGSVDGIRVGMYEVEQEYDLSTSSGAVDLAQAFIGAGLAEEVGAPPANAAAAEATDAAPIEQPESDAAEQPAAPAKPGRKPKAQ